MKLSKSRCSLSENTCVREVVELQGQTSEPRDLSFPSVPTFVHSFIRTFTHLNPESNNMVIDHYTEKITNYST